MGRNVHELIYDIGEILDTVEDEYISVMEERDDLQEKIKDLEEQEKEFPKAYDLGFEEGFAKGKHSMQDKVNKLCEFYWDTINVDILHAVFGNSTWAEMLENVEEAYNKIIEYEKEQEKIHIGDVVTVDGCNCIVLDVYDNGNTLSVITKSGEVVTLHKSCATKTGKHYPIDKMLKEL